MRTSQEAQMWQQRYGKVAYAGAWDDRWWDDAKVSEAKPDQAATPSHAPQLSMEGR